MKTSPSKPSSTRRRSQTIRRLKVAPLWVHPKDADALGLENGGLAKIETRIGHFVLRVWVTEGIHPGIVACSHHTGRWRLHREIGGELLSTSLVDIQREGTIFRFRQKEGTKPFTSADPDTERIWWKESGVNQNLTFPVQPDPVSGMHCWHQKVTVCSGGPDDRYGDIVVDTAKSEEVYREWLKLAKPAPGPDGLRRPLWLKRTLHPQEAAFRF